MAVLEIEIRPRLKFVDKEWLRQQMRAQDATTGFIPTPGATAQEARESIAADLDRLGIEPEDRIFSRGIAAMRDE